MERELLGQLVSAFYFQLRYQFTLPQAATAEEVLPVFFPQHFQDRTVLFKEKSWSILITLNLFLFDHS